ncbi:MAG: hypothetical protein HYZ24_14355 [Chloroflexi bacterium]|nr:hypothetical protein [Chloroflexota bacterium]
MTGGTLRQFLFCAGPKSLDFGLVKGRKMRYVTLSLLILTLASCSVPVDAPPPPTALPTATPQSTLTSSPAFTAIPTQTQPPVLTQTPIPTQSPDFCSDIRGTELIKSLSQAIADKDGALLASLVSPSLGMDVRYYRDGNVVNYDVEHAKFVFETTFQADWGLSFGSGEATLGSFQDIVLPTLEQVFTPNSLIVCGQLQTGGTTYIPQWPYPDMKYYSVYFPGTDQYGGLDWQTWAVGMDNVTGKPTIAALAHYVWEP